MRLFRENRLKSASFMGRMAIFSILTVMTGLVAAQASDLPQYSGGVHLGVASCAGSTCHGNLKGTTASNVMENEFITWQRFDKHARAYEVLLTNESKRIAANLGLKNAHEADMCLDCHADNPAPEMRGPKFQLTDGIGCEGCHGGGEMWLAEHASDPGHAKNVANGLYPTDEPKARAELCLSCHLGTADKFVTHRIMGAGHPRMSFELDTFTAIQPAHYLVDQDYVERKGDIPNIKVWTVGQAVSTQMFLGNLTNPQRNRDGMFPEFVLFDCHSCHESLHKVDWRNRPSGGLTPGLPVLNDSNILMVRAVAKQIAPDRAKRIDAKSKALHRATARSFDAMVAAAADLKTEFDGLVEELNGTDFNEGVLSGMLNGLISEGLRGEYIDYIAAEQATMAIGAVLPTMQAKGMITGEEMNAINAQLDVAYKAVKDEDRYNPSTFRKALTAIKEAVPQRVL